MREAVQSTKERLVLKIPQCVRAEENNTED